VRRADAIVRCALDLGLRSGEVARLSMDDIDWRAGKITLHQTKSRREDVLPLPVATSEAIAAYLRHERPKTCNRASSAIWSIVAVWDSPAATMPMPCAALCAMSRLPAIADR
jgi:integrase